jgi:glycine/D-amino acid oxidase-like deaminating enzyme
VLIQGNAERGGGQPPSRSLWLQDALAGERHAPTLRGEARADVAVVGGGYVGLWTALRLKEADPACDVAVVEADVCGAGASGRNGGQLHAWWERLDTLVALFGEQTGVWLARASEDAIDEIGRLQTEQGIEIDFRPAGWLCTASTPSQLGAWSLALDACRSRGITALRLAEADEIQRRTGSPVQLAGIAEDHAATVQPAKLARGLRRLALAAGVRIFEGSRVRLERSRPPRLHGAEGRLTADRIVIATNAWAARVPELRPHLFVVGSSIVATEPIPERIEALGLGDGVAVCDSQARVIYYQATRSGRLVFGRGGGRVAPLGRVGRSFDANPRWQADAERELRRVQPSLADVRITHGWGGPVDVSLTSLPLLGRLAGREDIVYGVGWSGTGIGPSVLGGRILASLALGVRDEWSTCALVDQPHRGRYPAEPLRSLGAVLVRTAVRHQAAADAAGRRQNRAVAALASLVPGIAR